MSSNELSTDIKDHEAVVEQLDSPCKADQGESNETTENISEDLPNTERQCLNLEKPETPTTSNANSKFGSIIIVHCTVLKADEPVLLKRCEDESCGCAKVHCPFCDVSQFKPTWSYKVQAHIDRAHMASAVWFENNMIVSCHHKCRTDSFDENKYLRHYHCPLCGKTILKRLSFAQHLVCHTAVLHKDPKVVVLPNPTLMKEIEFQGEKIKICQCPSLEKERHIHCPYCFEVCLVVQSLVAAHLWKCWERKNFMNESGDVETIEPTDVKPTEKLSHHYQWKYEKIASKLLPDAAAPIDMPEPPAGLKHPSEVDGLHYHPSIVRNLHDFPITDKCQLKNCCGGKFHCHLCETTTFLPTYATRVMKHAITHWRRRLPFGDYSVLVCYCARELEKYKDAKKNRCHYHCPVCGNTRRRRINFIHHLLSCGNSKNSHLSAYPDLNALYWSHIETQKEKLKLNENPDDTVNYLNSGTPDNINNSACSIKSESIEDVVSSLIADSLNDQDFSVDTETEVADSFTDEPSISVKNLEPSEPQPKLQIYNNISAVISQEIIDVLNKDGLVNKILDTISTQNNVSWSWSPGTLRTVHTFSGDLKNMAKAQEVLFQKVKDTAEDLADRIEIESNINVTDAFSQTEVNSTTKESECQTEQPNNIPDHLYSNHTNLPSTKDVGITTELSFSIDKNISVKLVESVSESPTKSPVVNHSVKKNLEKEKKKSAIIEKPKEGSKRYSTRGKILDFTSLASGMQTKKNKDKIKTEKNECRDDEKVCNGQNLGKCSERTLTKILTIAEINKDRSNDITSKKINSAQTSKNSNISNNNLTAADKSQLVRNSPKGCSSNISTSLANTEILKVIKPCHVPLHAIKPYTVITVKEPSKNITTSPVMKRRLVKLSTPSDEESFTKCNDQSDEELQIVENDVIEKDVRDVSVEVDLVSEDESSDESEENLELPDDEDCEWFPPIEPAKGQTKNYPFAITDTIKLPTVVYEPILKNKTTNVFQPTKYKRGSQKKRILTKDKSPDPTPKKKTRAEERKEREKCHKNQNEIKKESMKSCERCNYVSSEFSEMTLHLRDEHQIEQPLRCDICERIFQRPSHLHFHLVGKHGPFQEVSSGVCDKCGKKCDTPNRLAWHKSFFHGIHKKKNPLIKMYEKKEQQKQKQNEVRDTRKQCPHCGKKMNECNISTHIQAIHTKNKTGTCKICGKFFQHKRYLMMHLKRHSGVKNHICQVCGMKFMESNTLKDHIETHKDESERRYRYICNVCGKKFLSKCNFKEHENIHTGSKPHVCNECGRAFGNKNTLDKHKVYIHTTDRPFKCLHCQKSFKFKEKLNNHMVMHTGISKHTCTQCNKPIATLTNLKKHMKKCKGPKSLSIKTAKPRAGVNHVFERNMSSKSIPVAATSIINLPNDATYIVESDASFPVLEQNSLAEEAKSGDNEVFMCSECQETFSSLAEAQEHVILCQYQVQSQITNENVVFTLELHGSDVETNVTGNENVETVPNEMTGGDECTKIEEVEYQGDALEYTAVPSVIEEGVQVDINTA